MISKKKNKLSLRSSDLDFKFRKKVTFYRFVKLCFKLQLVSKNTKIV